MSSLRSQFVRHSLQLSLDRLRYSHKLVPGAGSSPSSPISARVVAPHTSSLNWAICSVLCLFDFESSDLDHLAFHKNEILHIVKQEDSGWWAAVRTDSCQVGWIPVTFVVPLSEKMSQRLRSIREDLRVIEYEAEGIHSSLPESSLHHLYEPVSFLSLSPSPSPPSSQGHEVGRVSEGTKITLVQPVSPATYSLRRSFPHAGPLIKAGIGKEKSSPLDTRVLHLPPSPSTPMPRPPAVNTVVSSFDKEAPSLLRPSYDARDLIPTLSESSLSGVPELLQGPDPCRPLILDYSHSLLRKPSAIESGKVPGLELVAKPDTTRLRSGGGGAAENDTLKFFNAMFGQSHLPWYLQPSFTYEQIQVDASFNVKAGTLTSLVERLTVVSPNPTHDITFRLVFFMTFRTFCTSEQLFDLLVEQFRMDHPEGLADLEFEDWKKRRLGPNQIRVLSVLTIWLEDHGLLANEPHIRGHLDDFLSLIKAPPALVITAKSMQQSLERLMSSPVKRIPPVTSTPKRRKPKAHKNDLLRLDPMDVVEHLCLLEHRLYAKISPQECLNWAKTQVGSSVENLRAFCATHDKLVVWVKTSILNSETLNRRIDTIDFWIKVAEKCRSLQNFSSMSALLTALSSASITRLAVTWAHTCRRSTLDALLKYNEPTGRFRAYRTLLQSAEGPAVPFITMFLTDIVHTNQLADTLPSPSNPDLQLINFSKRHRWYDIVSTMLKHQHHVYNLAENDSIREFVEMQLAAVDVTNSDWFWIKSKEVQQLELYADIRDRLDAAGF